MSSLNCASLREGSRFQHFFRDSGKQDPNEKQKRIFVHEGSLPSTHLVLRALTMKKGSKTCAATSTSSSSSRTFSHRNQTQRSPSRLLKPSSRIDQRELFAEGIDGLKPLERADPQLAVYPRVSSTEPRAKTKG
ncbi:hypothetical protein DXG03_005877 [Asterophora parasitica]|uniref:Uncharacterized protein n=1 Tax=Asterophora parasitica TaxID=117018 RepID=A0A9P7KAS3_9AGAR|nr:hypothetical protein DXG03_005877 [Asterophora parasitica]